MDETGVKLVDVLTRRTTLQEKENIGPFCRKSGF